MLMSKLSLLEKTRYKSYPEPQFLHDPSENMHAVIIRKK